MEKGVNVIVPNKRGRILVLKRSQKVTHYPSTWNLPGGRVDGSESLQDAAIREINEETGLKIEPAEKHFSVYYYPDGVKKNAVIAVYALESKLISGKLKLDHAHEDFKWISRNSWQALSYTPSCKTALKELFKE